MPPAFLEASAGHPEGSPEAIAVRASGKAFTMSDTGAHSNTRPVLLSSKMQLLVQELLSRKVRGCWRQGLLVSADAAATVDSICTANCLFRSCRVASSEGAVVRAV